MTDAIWFVTDICKMIFWIILVVVMLAMVRAMLERGGDL